MIMSFAEEFKPVYKDHIVPVIRNANLSIKRGDDFYSKHSIMNEIWFALNSCRFVIADCAENS